MKKVLLMLFALAFAASAAAQAYKWVDKDGKVRYGDTPPPGVKATPLKAPPPAPRPAPSADAKKDAGAKKDEKPLSPEAAFRKRQQEKQEAEQKSDKERAEAATRRQNCDNAQANLRNLQSGQRIATVNAAGERVIMEDPQREQAVKQAQRSVAEWCK